MEILKESVQDKIYCAPGNAGIAELAECVDIGAMEFEKLADFAQEKAIDLTQFSCSFHSIKFLHTNIQKKQIHSNVSFFHIGYKRLS